MNNDDFAQNSQIISLYEIDYPKGQITLIRAAIKKTYAVIMLEGVQDCRVTIRKGFSFCCSNPSVT
jgi:hypothetical protein